MSPTIHRLENFKKFQGIIPKKSMEKHAGSLEFSSEPAW